MAKKKMDSSTGSTEEMLESTGLGQVISRHKVPVIAAVVCLLIAIVGFGVYSSHKEKKSIEYGKMIYEFSEKELKDLADNKIEAKLFTAKFKELAKKVESDLALAPLVLKSADTLLANKKLEEASEILQFGHKEFRSENPYLAYFMTSRLATVYEDLNRDKDAIKILEEMTKLPQKFLEGKIYLDLGRLYLRAGNKDRARVNLKYVAEKITSGGFAKIAKLYLLELDKK